MRILVTNDDGIDAPGIEVLCAIASGLSDDVWVVAPEHDRSGASHSITLTEPLRFREVSERKFAVQGTPTDCVILGVRHILKDTPPDLVLSGVNRGQNMADDVTYSGTIACAKEGAMLGVRSVALSLANMRNWSGGFKWQTPRAIGADLVKRFLDIGWSKDVVLNVNFPDCEADEVKGVKITSQGLRNESLLEIVKRDDTRGVPYYWIAYQRVPFEPREGTDIWAVQNGYVSVTPLFLDLTHQETRSNLETAALGDVMNFGTF